MNVYIPSGNITDMRGPCAEGFHVPSKDELENVYNAGIDNGAWTSSGGTDFSTYLKMPFAGRRFYTDGGIIVQQGTIGWYSTVSAYSATRIYALGMKTSSPYKYNNLQRSIGCSIRPFKDTPVAPDSGWAVLYQGIGTAGIYHNSTLGLISISSNGTNWITISDKNLGATTVYNSGDTLSESNCGKYYQRGNNYGFPFTGSVTYSTTQVDASNYGPGNYYSSSTFITQSDDWSSVQNDNLRGGVTGPFNMNELKNAYIGEVPPLCFTANTASSTIKLSQNGTPTAVTLETSTDGTNWSTYTIGTTITLANIGDKVYFRNPSTTDTLFNLAGSNTYKFVMTGSIAASGDVTTLLNKNSTDTVSDYAFHDLFYNCSSLTTPPELKAATIGVGSYAWMFGNCTNLLAIPKLIPTNYPNSCCGTMFNGCTKIKLSTTQTGEYQTSYRIPSEGTGTVGTLSFNTMFGNTGGTFTGTPSINTTYYTSNTVV